ncbi:MAG: peptide chain release factor N(5)-glutamine methyltransferase [Hyphomicrobiales bacterium]|nr:peptide chain release factor N(5)-glutamine methyltransferase [Hyphomicrobiales bacterium]MDE2115987.1 peptide chain release factor N(5)-glutamine methyltransferase [Hyphomicrobiales bacterium]
MEPQTTRAQAVRQLTETFGAAGLESPALDARLLVCAGLEIDHAGLILRPDLPLGVQASVVQSYAQRRLAHEPVSRILGEREFWGLRFAVTPAVLDPRADSETIVESALACLDDRGRRWRILDIGTGSGALLAALLHELPQASGLGIDVSGEACKMARANLAQLGMATRANVRHCNWDDLHGLGMDLIVSNPPYIEARAIAGLAPEVRLHDPMLALDGGADGLAAYRGLMPVLARNLVPGGASVLEIGAGQAEDVCALAQAQGFAIIAQTPDLNQIVRAISLRRH